MNQDILDDVIFSLNNLLELNNNLYIQIIKNDEDELVTIGEIVDFFFNKEQDKMIVTIKENHL